MLPKAMSMYHIIPIFLPFDYGIQIILDQIEGTGTWKVFLFMVELFAELEQAISP